MSTRRWARQGRRSRAAAMVAMATLAGLASAQTQIDLGKREFEAKCAVCHGLDARGNGPYADQLKNRMPDLTTLAKRNGGVFPVSKTFETIEGAGKGHGPRDMPVWGLDYTAKAAETLPDMPYNQAVYVRTRIMALLEYLNQLQVK
jgi:mono/diheme cytochrome c family protein